MAQPFFSIIIPTYARPRQLALCLQSLTYLDYPPTRFEVIVVDDGSETSPEAVVARYANQIKVMLLTQSHAGPAAARNTGAMYARGDFLAFTDDDCLPAPDWLQSLAARFTKTPDHIIGGRTLNKLPNNPYSATSQLVVDTVYAHYNSDPNQARFFASNNLAVSTDYFHSIGGFDVAFTTSEDRELCDRWLHHGYQMTYAPEVLVYHAHMLTLHTFWRQHFHYGRGAFRFHQTRARRGWGRFRIELTFYLNLLSLLKDPLLRVRAQQGVLLGVLLVVWQVANTAGFLWEGLHQIREKFAVSSQKRLQRCMK